MPSTRRHSYDLNFKLKIVAEAEAVDNNCEIAREYGISESMVRKWRNQQHVLFPSELKMTAKHASMGVFTSTSTSTSTCSSTRAIAAMTVFSNVYPISWERG